VGSEEGGSVVLISEEYRSLNSKLHQDRKDYGVQGKMYAPQIRQLAESLQTTDVLDYGCGKGTLAANLPFPIHQYDPAVAEHDTEPMPADLVVCTDVLEHIEPECLADVLNDLKRVTRHVLFCTVATRPAKKKLADGRNAHLIIETIEWWLPRLMERFTLRNVNAQDEMFVALLEAHRHV
jgi:2-polyprenyl-3-methyl-5-hydroxy-6-metoxy-1,4-benzoquinol methylase